LDLSKTTITAAGYLWGQSAEALLSSLPASANNFDLIILADILFNHSEHKKLIQTLQQTMGQTSSALVFFTPYRPWLLQKDLAFFEIARAEGFSVTKIMEHTMDKVMFDEDPGDEQLRRTVFGYRLARADP
jgi:EEF1A N-terminal glycine/lysine methyltransferase